MNHQNRNNSMRIKIVVDSFVFVGKLLLESAPETSAEFLKLLPLKRTLLQARWSGEPAWIPLDTPDFKFPFENVKNKPMPGELLFYPGGLSEPEILFPYGQTVFASKFGEHTANHFLTLIEGQENLQELGHTVLWKGARNINFELHP